jgi:hypothetical protein
VKVMMVGVVILTDFSYLMVVASVIWICVDL